MGTTEAQNAVSKKTWPVRVCKTCGGEYARSSSNSECGACIYAKRRDKCRCGEWKDRRSELCQTCRRATPQHSHNWAGGKYKDRDGYVRVFVRSGKYVPEHRLVMEQKIGRKLEPGETVHHKNGMRSDNRVENLELWAKSHQPGMRVFDMVQWALATIKMYGGNLDAYA